MTGGLPECCIVTSTHQALCGVPLQAPESFECWFVKRRSWCLKRKATPHTYTMRGGLGPRHWGEGEPAGAEGQEQPWRRLGSRTKTQPWPLAICYHPIPQKYVRAGKGDVHRCNQCVHTQTHMHTLSFIHGLTLLCPTRSKLGLLGSLPHPCTLVFGNWLTERLPQMPLGPSIIRKASAPWSDQSVRAQDDRAAAFEMSFAEAYRYSHSTGPK